ncbi:MAG: magnesium transporter [Lachnospiraceae bacterium]|nr:magnesium transporter [Lachnospiraceae bacterium]
MEDSPEKVPDDLEPVEHGSINADEPLERPDYGEEIRNIIRSNASPKIMRDKLENYHASDLAEVLEDLSPALRIKVYRVLDDVMLSDIMEYLDEEEASQYLNEMDPKRAAAVITEIEPDEAVAILRQIPREKRMLLIDLLDEESRKDVRLIASFDEEEIGSRMTTNYIVIRENLSIKGAMTELIAQAAENDNISTLFVVDESGAFYGAIDLKELIIARQDGVLEDLIVTSFPYVYGHETIDDCIEKLKDYSENSIPVLDNFNKLIGVITSTDIIEVVDEEMGEDYARLAGLTAEEDIEEPLIQSLRKRLPWLMALLVLGLGVSAVVGIFEKVVSRLTLIMAFQSMILDMSGNSGTQSLAVTIRVLTDEALTGKQKVRQFLKEVRNGLFNGLILGVFSILLVGVYIMLGKGQPAGTAFLISGCIGVSLMIAMTFSSAIGTFIPMFFKKIGVDPAVASGPFITTLNDFLAVIIYYSLCYILLLETFHLG